jgi:hypothetical protein
MTITLNDIDQTEAWSAGGGLLPPGRHLCRIVDTEEGESSNGNPQMILTLEAIAGEHVGGQIKDWIVVVPQTYGRVRQILDAAGLLSSPASGSSTRLRCAAARCRSSCARSRSGTTHPRR